MSSDTENKSMDTGFYDAISTKTTSDKSVFFLKDEIPLVDLPYPKDGFKNVPDTIRENVDLETWYNSRVRKVRTLLNQTDDNAYSLVEIEQAPDTLTPRHKHTEPQVVFVLRGEIHQGNKVLRAGDGYYTPAGRVYESRSGPEGATILEFRHAGLSGRGVTWTEDSPARWTS